jgi:hypothetical protein
MPKFAEGKMLVKQIARVTYWLAVICLLLALISRLMNALGFEAIQFTTKGHPVDYHSFLDATILFLFASMASSLYARLES